MGDEPATPAAPAAPVTPESFSFSRPGTPAPAATAPVPGTDVPTTPAAATPEKKPDDKRPEVSAIAKLSAENRASKAIIARLQGEIDAKKADGGKTVELQSELDAIKKNPRLLLKHGQTFESILKALSEEDEPGDPRVAELQAWRDEQTAKEAKAEEDRKKAEQDAESASDKKSIDEANANIARLIGEDGKVIAADGRPRWAVVSGIADAPERARTAVWDQLLIWEKEDGKMPAISAEDAKVMIFSALDQMEARERARIIREHGLLNGGVESPDRRTSTDNRGGSFSTEDRQQIQPTRRQPTADPETADDARPTSRSQHPGAMEWTR